MVGNLDGQIDQFQKLSALYAEFLPKQARWQAELLVLDMVEGHATQTVLADMNSATDSVRQIAGVVEAVPELVARERDILRQTIVEERVATMDNLGQMQSATMSGLKQIQSDTVQEMRRERIAVSEDLQQELATTLDILRDERAAATQDLTEFGRQIIDQLDASASVKIDDIARRSVHLADHFFKRIIQLGIAVLLLMAIIWWWQRPANRSPSREDRQLPFDPARVLREPNEDHANEQNRFSRRRAA